MTLPETDNGSALGAGERRIDMPMEKVTCWEGANGNLKKSQWDAACDIIGNAGYGDAHCMTDVPAQAKSQKLKDAIFWLADEMRKKKPTPKKRTRR